jgi:hypothetical protein
MGKLTMMLIFMMAIFTIAGNVTVGGVAFAATGLTIAVTETDSVITVDSTEGFNAPGFITIENEQIAYSSTTATTFKGNVARPLIRGANGTEATAHPVTAIVRTQEGGILSQSASYAVATMTDTSGVQAFVSAPLGFFALIGSIIFVPLDFLGGDLAMLTYIWAIVGIGFIVAITIQMGGGRRV